MFNISTHQNRLQRTAFNIVVFLLSASVVVSVIKFIFS